MKRLRGLLLVFCIGLSIPLAYFVLRTYRSLEQEETDQLRFFAETLFDEMERDLALLVRREEARPVDAYTATEQPLRSPEQSFIVGYFQNNPDGTIQIPETTAPGGTPVRDTLMTANRRFNKRRAGAIDDLFEVQPVVSKPAPAPKQESDSAVVKKRVGFAERYLRRAPAEEKSAYLGQREKRVETLTPGQAMNLARQSQAPLLAEGAPMADEAEQREMAMEVSPPRRDGIAMKSDAMEREQDAGIAPGAARNEPSPPVPYRMPEPHALQAEVDPMQSVFIDDAHIFLFRRVALANRIFRQGVLIQIESALNYLAANHFSPQPLARFTHLTLTVRDRTRLITTREDGVAAQPARFSLERTFPRPFSALTARITCRDIPESPGRNTLNLMIGMLTVIMLLGLFAIYRSARTIADLSERRARFVSSVTHELKTPLTNIRMYIEMLEQGIAVSPEREQEYFRILEAESARLSRLINNILEFSKLEKKQIHFNWTVGDLSGPLRGALDILGESLKQAEFRVVTKLDPHLCARYDREIMTQVLINLMENSLKFGKESPEKTITVQSAPEERWAVIRVSDTGPGIPRKELKRIFHDFYRVESALIHNTKGTGIGLAFVRKVITAMGGRVLAANNSGPGCVIEVRLPRHTSGGAP